ncbi:MAG TPA: PAS domain-containing protein [Opitutaceae bacterium]|nr:PAS domain-containing protein [Opitutaceae bacterium]
MADTAARALWRAGESELIGEHFSALFAFEVTTRDTRWLEAQWDVLLAAASSAPLRLTAQPKDGARVEVSVHLEKAPSAAGTGCLAFVLPAGAPRVSDSDLLAVLADRSPVGIFDLNFKVGTFYYSPVWKRQLGYAEHELAATFETWRELLHPEDSAAAPDRVATKFFSGARGFSAEYRLRHKRGHYVWIHGVGVQVFGPEGELERVAGLNLDITERKEFEEASVESEERLQELTEHGHLGAFDLNFAADRHWFSPAWKRLLGYAPADLIDGPDALASVLHPDDAQAGLKEFFLSRHPGEPAYLDLCRLRHKDGHFLWVLGGVFRQVSRKRELLRVLGFHCALPRELPLAGEEVVPAAMFAAALAELQQGVIMADAGGRVLFANDKAARLLGETTAALRGRPLGELFPLVHRATGQAAGFPADRLLELAEVIPLNNDHALARGEGVEPQPIAFSARPVPDAAGRVVGAVVVFRNPQEMTLTPEELVKADRFESLGVLASGIAHDFNNLLTTILGGVSLAKDNHNYSALEDSENACLAAKGLTKQLLTFARGGASVQTVLAPLTVLKEAARLAAAGATTEVAIEVAAGTGNLHADRGQILQVFQNLIVNAIQAMPEGHPGHVWLRAGGVTLTEDQVASLPAGHYVQFEVQDDGAGIPPENLEKIFDAFFTTKKHGTGLGLATVLDIVRRHGGQIGVDSTVGAGTTFTLFLPVAGQSVEVEARRAPTLRFGTGRVLFMDDDEKICALTAGMLDGLEYKYDLAKNGEEAIALYKRYLNIGRPYDAVIMDLTIIGGMGGEEAFKRLRELDPDVRAIVTSGYDSEEMAKQYLDLGFCGYLTKPYRVTELGRILKTVLG